MTHIEIFENEFTCPMALHKYLSSLASRIANFPNTYIGNGNGNSNATPPSLLKKTWDSSRIGSERWSANAANFSTQLRWNWNACGTIEKVKTFFQRVLTDGTLSRVDFATIVPPEGDFKFRYGHYDEQFEEELQPYIENLKKFRCEYTKKGKIIPFHLQQLDDLEDKMDDYIRDYAKGLPDDTWKDYAWRTKLIAMKKILILYIANGGQWEEEFETFFWWSFHYSMWVKMQLFYAKAREAFVQESIVGEVQCNSPLDFVGDTFTRDEFNKACIAAGYKTKPRITLCKMKKNGKILPIEGQEGVYKKG